MERRAFLGARAAPRVVGTVADAWSQEPSAKPAPRKGRLKQGVTGGVFARAGLSFEDQCREATKLGIEGFDLRGPNDWPTLKKYGLVPSMYPGGPGGTIPIGPSHKDTHAELIPKMHAAIDEAAANGVPNIIVLGGEKRGTTFGGVSMDVLFEEAEPLDAYSMVYSSGGYTTNLAIEDLTDGKAWVVTEHDGDPLPREHGGPARLLVPHLYFWKSAKWVRGIRVMDHDEPGFWESNGYHNRGDPWQEQRYWTD